MEDPSLRLDGTGAQASQVGAGGESNESRGSTRTLPVCHPRARLAAWTAAARRRPTDRTPDRKPLEPVATDDAGPRYPTKVKAFARAGRDKIVALERELNKVDVPARRARIGQLIMHETNPKEGTEPEHGTARTPASIHQSPDRVASGSEHPSIQAASRIDADFWAAPPTRPRLVAPKIDAHTIDNPPQNAIAAVPVPVPVPVPETNHVEDALYNIAAIPVGDALFEATLFEDPAEDHLAAVIGTPDHEGPAQDWEGGAACVPAAGDDSSAVQTAEPQMDTHAVAGPTGYYRAALRITEPIDVRLVENPTPHTIEDEAAAQVTEPQLEADMLLEGPAQDWSRTVAVPVSNDASSTGDRGSATLELVTSTRPATTVTDLDPEPS
jgi:hypothetical protein